MLIKFAFGYRTIYNVLSNILFMRIIKSIDKKVGNKTYFKYKINLPKKAVEKTGLLDQAVQIREEKGTLIIEKVNEERSAKLTPKEKRLQKEILKLIK